MGAEKAKRKSKSAPSEGVARKKKKKTKLPGQPKKPMSAYFLWLNEEGRELIKKENPDAGVTDINKAAGEKWREMGESTKKKYEEMHKELKEKYKEWFECKHRNPSKQAKKEAGGSMQRVGEPTEVSGKGFQDSESGFAAGS